MKSLVIATLLSFACIAVNAQVNFEQPAYGGAACPAGRPPSLVTLERNGLLQFPDFIIYSEGLNSPLFARGSCNVRQPISVTEGFQVGIRLVNVTGYVYQNSNTRSNLEIRMGFVGGELNKVGKSWSGLTDTNFNLQTELSIDDFRWSECGGHDAMLVIDTAATTTRGAPSQSAALWVDELKFDIATRRCR